MESAKLDTSCAHRKGNSWNSAEESNAVGLLTPVFDWDRDDASSHDEGEAQQWYDGGDTMNKVSRERRNCQSSSVEMQCDVQSCV